MGARRTVYLATAILTGTGAVLLTPRPVAGVAREMLELQEGVKQLIQGQKEIDTTLVQNAAVNKTLLEQPMNTVNKMAGNMMALEKTVEETKTSSGSRMDTMATQLEEISDNVQAALGRMAKFTQQLADVQSALRGIDAKLADSASVSNGVPSVPPRGRTKH